MYSHFASKSGKIYKRKECNECRGEKKKRNIEVCNFIGPLTSLYGC